MDSSHTFQVPAVSFVAPHMTVFPAIGAIHTGLVVDIGNVTRIIPVRVKENAFSTDDTNFFDKKKYQTFHVFWFRWPRIPP